MIDREDIEQAVEIALGDMLESDGRAKQAASDKQIAVAVQRLKRVLRELPGHIMVQDILDALDD